MSVKPSKRILVAEDVPALSESMRLALETEGFAVKVVQDGAECLREISSYQPALVLLDARMPKLDGLDVLKRLRADEQTKEIGVIICTSQPYAVDFRQLEELGAVDVLFKPFKQNELTSKVNRFFNHGNSGSADGDRQPGAVATPRRPILEAPSKLSVRCWGTRGSTPVSGNQYSRHGGNTSCLSLRRGDDLIIFDSGTGIRELGGSLADGGPFRLHLFITHTHWDHIQGFPFFLPAFIPGFKITIYGENCLGQSLESLFRGQLQQDYFPVQLEDLQANLTFQTLGKEPIRIGDVTITSECMNHPGTALGFKIRHRDRTTVIIPDNEFLEGYLGFPDAASIGPERLDPYRRVVEFVSDADVFFHEAQYTNLEYSQRVGWGHSGLSNACLLAKLGNVKRWIITHHDPAHDDAFLECKLNLTRQLLDELGHPIEVVHAYDGMVTAL